VVGNKFSQDPHLNQCFEVGLIDQIGTWNDCYRYLENLTSRSTHLIRVLGIKVRNPARSLSVFELMVVGWAMDGTSVACSEAMLDIDHQKWRGRSQHCT
jgi:hypothetical protein